MLPVVSVAESVVSTDVLLDRLDILIENRIRDVEKENGTKNYIIVIGGLAFLGFVLMGNIYLWRAKLSGREEDRRGSFDGIQSGDIRKMGDILLTTLKTLSENLETHLGRIHTRWDSRMSKEDEQTENLTSLLKVILEDTRELTTAQKELNNYLIEISSRLSFVAQFAFETRDDYILKKRDEEREEQAKGGKKDAKIKSINN